MLWRYANYHQRIRLLQETVGVDKEQKLPEKLSVSIDKMRQRQIGVRSVLDIIGLEEERTTIDELFEEANEIQGRRIKV